MKRLINCYRFTISFFLDEISSRKDEGDARLSNQLLSMVEKHPHEFQSVKILDVDSGAVMLLDFSHELYCQYRGREIAILAGSERWYYRLPVSRGCIAEKFLVESIF